MQVRQFEAGDGVRGFAALSIVLFHLWVNQTLTHAGAGDRSAFADFGRTGPWLGNLETGVYVFFVLSGYLIGRPWIASVVGGEALPSVRRYAWRRLLRIAPGFWVALTVVLVWFGASGGVDAVLATYAFVQVAVPDAPPEFVQGWTVGVEVVFYALVPLAALGALGLRRRGVPATVLVPGAIAVVLVAGLAVRVQGDSARWLHSAPAVLYAFTPGLALAYVEVRWGARLAGRRAVAWAGVAALVLVIPLYELVIRARTDGLLQVTLAQLALCALAVGGPLAYEWSTGKGLRLFTNPASRWLGSRSYAIYLVHVGVIVALQNLLLRTGSSVEGFLLGLPVVLGLTAVLAELLHRYVERPAMAFARRPTARAVPREATPARSSASA